MKIAMWSPLRRPVSRRTWATWLAPASYSAKVSVRPEGAMTMAGWSGCSLACSAAYTDAPFSRVPQARVQHVDETGAHERERLVLQVVAHEADADANRWIGEPDLAAGAHVPERTVVGSVHRRRARNQSRGFERVADGPSGRDAHDCVAPADLLCAEALHRGPRDELLAVRQRGVRPGDRPARPRRAQGADLRRQDVRRVHELGEPGPPELVGEQAAACPGQHRAPGLRCGIDRSQCAFLARLHR